MKPYLIPPAQFAADVAAKVESAGLPVDVLVAAALVLTLAALLAVLVVGDARADARYRAAILRRLGDGAPVPGKEPAHRGDPGVALAVEARNATPTGIAHYSDSRGV